jgi:hypothetical protein
MLSFDQNADGEFSGFQPSDSPNVSTKILVLVLVRFTDWALVERL